jgi:hypothetical protein
MLDPSLDGGRGGRVGKFTGHFNRNRYGRKQVVKKIDVPNQDQVPDGAGVGYDE